MAALSTREELCQRLAKKRKHGVEEAIVAAVTALSKAVDDEEEESTCVRIPKLSSHGKKLLLEGLMAKQFHVWFAENSEDDDSMSLNISLDCPSVPGKTPSCQCKDMGFGKQNSFLAAHY